MKSKGERKNRKIDFVFFAPNIKLTNQLPEQESRHCIKVLRMTEGDILTATDGKGYLYECTIVQAHHKSTIVNIEKETFLPKSWNFDIQIAFSPTKNMDRNEWFVEKATEIGVDRLIPLLCRYSERKELRLDRLEKVSIAAMKQSKQALNPIIEKMTPFETFIKQPFNGNKYIAHCYNNEKNIIKSVYKKGENALILIGPEGDFSEDEIQLAINHNFIPISLGENRLRTETACFVACHTIHVLNT